MIYHIYNSHTQEVAVPVPAFTPPAPFAWPELTPDIYLPAIPASVKKQTITLPNILSKLALSFAVVGFAILAITYGPSLYYFVEAYRSNSQANFSLSQNEVNNLTQPLGHQRSTYQPPVNPRLTKADHLVIPAIGVNTDIEEATSDNYETALKKGVWRVSNFGAPNDNSRPTILAAHRYGYLAWSNLYRRENSFFNLPKLKVGDTVEIDWGQRKYMYEIYAEGTGTEITDYNADLILYTCVNLTGDQRIFKYARLMEI